MKNSTLLLIISFLFSIIFSVINAPIIVLHIFMIVLFLMFMIYLLLCWISCDVKPNNAVIPKKYNILEIIYSLFVRFIDWLDSFPQLIKSKVKWECYEKWRPNIPMTGCKQQCEWCKIKQDETKNIK